MNWMNKWATAAPIAGDPRGFPIFIESAQGAELVDVDGHRYADFCLGDTGAMTGHSPKPIVEALGRRAAHGFTFMLPSPQSIEASRILAERFGPTAVALHGLGDRRQSILDSARAAPDESPQDFDL